MSNNISKKVRSFFIKLGITMFGLGFSIATLVFILSFTGFQQFWIWYDALIKFSLVMIMGGITVVFVFGTWVIFGTSTRKTIILNIAFNYGVMLLTFGGGIIYLIGYFLLGDTNILLVGMRCYVVGILMLIARNTLVRFFMR